MNKQNRHGPMEARSTRLRGRAQAAFYLGITTRSLDRLVAKGVLVPVRIAGVRRTLFEQGDLDALVQSVKQLQVSVGAGK
jgi:hypothetical protein